MKNLLTPILLALALTMSTPVVAQTFDQAVAAYNNGDYQNAFIDFKKLAEQGNAEAQTWLGMMYSKGKGIPEDDQEAVDWYRKAAEQGDAEAQYNLGVMYGEGTGVSENDRLAATWYRKAANQGIAEAQYNLGVMYANGTGLPKDELRAYFWWLLASAQGYASAIHYRDEVEKGLTPQQRASAQNQASNWKPAK